MTGPLHLFEGFGIELEYMIVNRETLDVFPCCDRLMSQVVGSPESEYEDGDIAWSNELALHVVEIKTNGPARELSGLDTTFNAHVKRINGLLEPMGAMLLPTGMHPWMKPMEETRLWPHEYTEIYRTYDRIFDCRGHGWSNLQSTHINLPFANDEEFGRLHAAIRIVLPLLPALAASSPLVEGKLTGIRDNRLEYYRNNQAKVPAIAGKVIPEPVYTEAEYRKQIFEVVARDIAPLDPGRILEPVFLNSRGAIARFDRGAIEIRLLDIQESPRADLAICALVIRVIRALVEERWSPVVAQKGMGTIQLAEILHGCIREAHCLEIRDHLFLHLLGIMRGKITAGEVWNHLFEEFASDLAEWKEPLGVILNQGPLTARIQSRLSGEPKPGDLLEVYREIAGCLARGELFSP